MPIKKLAAFALSHAFAGLLGCATQSAPDAKLQGNGQGPDVNPDPCAGKELPKCAAECSAPPGELVGKECSADAKCGNNIGDECACVSGKWSCSPHAPLGGPGACNLTCR